MARNKTDGRGNYVGDAVELDVAIGSLPFISGAWYFVDPLIGSNSNDGLAPGAPLADIESAYDKCVSGQGDGIVVISRGTGTSSQTTSYLKAPLTWAKHGITVVGVAAPVSMFGRARVATQDVTSAAMDDCAQAAHAITRETGSFLADGWEVGMKGAIADSGSNNDATFTVTAVTALTITVSETLNVQAKASTISTTLLSYCTHAIEVSGSNNAFYNLHVYNGGASDLSVGGIKVSGNRNFFKNVSAIGAAGTAAAATANGYDLFVNGGQENTFERCVFGTDTVLKGDAATVVKFDSDAWRTRFYDCEFIIETATAGAGGISIADATALSGYQLFKDCTFLLWNDNGVGASTALVIGTKPNSGQLIFDKCAEYGWSAWGASGMAGCVLVAAPAVAANGGGGIATTVA